MEWESYYNEAVDYCNVAQNAFKKGKLGNMVIYHITGMSVENFMTSLLMREGVFPEHSSVSGMLRELKKTMPVPEDFTSEVRFMNSFMNFCSLEVTPERIPSDEETTRMLRFLTSLWKWIDSCLEIERKAV